MPGSGADLRRVCSESKVARASRAQSARHRSAGGGRSSVIRRGVGVALLLALVFAGCGSTTTTPSPSALAAVQLSLSASASPGSEPDGRPDPQARGDSDPRADPDRLTDSVTDSDPAAELHVEALPLQDEVPAGLDRHPRQRQVRGSIRQLRLPVRLCLAGCRISGGSASISLTASHDIAYYKSHYKAKVLVNKNITVGRMAGPPADLQRRRQRREDAFPAAQRCKRTCRLLHRHGRPVPRREGREDVVPEDDLTFKPRPRIL